MHKILPVTAGALLTFSMGSTFAADLPAMKGPPVYAPPVFSWTGFYVGGNVGYVDSNDSVTTTAVTGPPPFGGAAQAQITGGTVPPGNFSGHNGVTAGGQIGFNYEFPTASELSVVAGVESDFAYTDLRGTNLVLDPTTGTNNTYSSSLRDLGTVRGRLGAAFDRALVYVTGGFAYGYSQYSHFYNNNAVPSTPIWAGGVNGERTGFVVGAGVEYALNVPAMGGGAWTVRAEYLHYDLGTATATIPFVAAAVPIPPFLDRYRIDGNIVRVGLNYKFDLFGAPAPVAAKY